MFYGPLRNSIWDENYCGAIWCDPFLEKIIKKYLKTKSCKKKQQSEEKLGEKGKTIAYVASCLFFEFCLLLAVDISDFRRQRFA